MCELDGLRGKMYLRDGSKWFIHSGNRIRVSSQLHNHCPAIPLSCVGVVLNVWFLYNYFCGFSELPQWVILMWCLAWDFLVQRLRHGKNLGWMLYRTQVLPTCLCSSYLAAPLFTRQMRETFFFNFPKNRTVHDDGFPGPRADFSLSFFAWSGSLFVGVRVAHTAHVTHVWVSQCGQALSVEWQKQEWKWGEDRGIKGNTF